MRWIAVVAVSLLLLSPARASHFLGFSGGGYHLQMDVVLVEPDPPRDWYWWIGDVRATVPGSGERVMITDGVVVDAYEWSETIDLRYDGSDPRIPAFRLLVRGTEASLYVSGEVIHSEFGWIM